MDKGQHLRLLIKNGNNKNVFALATGLTFHLVVTTEDSTTKDTTDSNGSWNEYEITQRSGDIQIEALIGAGTDSAAKTLNDVINGIDDSLFDWELALVGGTNNRVISTSIATGQGKFVSVNPQGQNRQQAQYTATMNIYGPVVVASES